MANLLAKTLLLTIGEQKATEKKKTLKRIVRGVVPAFSDFVYGLSFPHEKWAEQKKRKRLTYLKPLQRGAARNIEEGLLLFLP